jgi:hypothetical protein
MMTRTARKDNEERDYIKELYIPSQRKDWPPVDPDIELRMMSFASRLERMSQCLSNRRRRTNLSPQQHRMIKLLRDDTRFIICLTDKNLGPAIIERDVYIRMGLEEHLLNGYAYRRLSPEEASKLVTKTEEELKQLVKDYAHCLSSAEDTYFTRSYNLRHRVPRFYLTMKVHKTPMTSRPVVSCVGSFNEIFSKWLDFQMSRLLPLSHTYLRDSTQVLSELKNLGDRLPPQARLFTADAVSMYTNIDTAHALTVFRRWFTEFPEEIPTDFPVALFLAVLEIIMTRNVFEFDDTCWLQIAGTAMGTSCACMFATLYYALHERLSLLPHYHTQLLYFKRFIDDIFGIWIGNNEQWSSFKSDLNTFGSLRWEASPLANTAIFLDLEIKLTADQRIETKTYQKPQNLFLYIPPASAHAPGVIKSTVFGNLQRFWNQNSNISDYQTVTKEFAKHLELRGHDREQIRKLFAEAAAMIDRKRTTSSIPQRRMTSHADPSNTLFLHQEYHPRGISRRMIRRVYRETLEAVSGFDRFVVAYSRPRNLRDVLMRSKLSEPAGHRASDIIANLPEQKDPTLSLREV